MINYPHRLETSDNDLADIGQVPGGKDVSPHIRKAQCHFGWDWGPRLVTSGIWKPVWLKGWNGARITDLRIVQNSLSDEKASLTGYFEIESAKQGTATLSIECQAVPFRPPKRWRSGQGTHIYAVDFEIEKPRRWWTNGLGEAYLYDVSGSLETDEGVQQICSQHWIAYPGSLSGIKIRKAPHFSSN